MAFKITRNPTYTVPVVVEMPNSKGKTDIEKFMAEFKRVGLERLQELRAMTPSEIMEEVLVGWTDLIDEDGEKVDFNDMNKKALFDIPQAFAALVAAFWNSIHIAKKGN